MRRGASLSAGPTCGRGGGIRTHDLFVPNEARYQAAPHPEGLAESNGPRLGLGQPGDVVVTQV